MAHLRSTKIVRSTLEAILALVEDGQGDVAQIKAVEPARREGRDGLGRGGGLETGTVQLVQPVWSCPRNYQD